MAEPLASLIRPEPGPSLPALARLAPPPPLNLIAAEIEARTGPGDIVVDLHGRGGWVARSAVGRLRRAVDFETSALTRLLADVVLRPPDLRHLDAALNALAVQPHGEVGLRQALTAMWASRCATCGRPVILDELIWDGEAEVPSRKAYRCISCRDQVGGGEQRTAAVDADDIRLATEAPPGEAESHGQARAALRERFPVLSDEAAGLPDHLLDLYTPRALVAIQALLAQIEGDLRAAPIEAALRLALVHIVQPASRLNSYPGRPAALRIVNGRVRPPGERQWRERNPWLLFEDGVRLVRGFVQRLEAQPGGPVQARPGFDLDALGEGAANVVVRQGSAALADNVPPEDRRSEARSRVRLVLSQPPARWTPETLSFAYLATAMALGREAAAALPVEPLMGGTVRSEPGWEASALRRSLMAVAPTLAADARAVIILEPTGPEGLVAAALGGVGAGYRLTAALLAEAGDAVGGTLELVPPGGLRRSGPRTRANVRLPDVGEAGAEDPAGGKSSDAPDRPFRLADVEEAVAEIAVEVLQARGEPARFERLIGEVLVGLDRRGLLRRLVGTRTFGETEARSERAARAAGFATPPEPAGPGEEPTDAAEAPEPTLSVEPAPADSPPSGADHVRLLLELVGGELRRPDHRRLRQVEPGRWWLADPRDLAGAALPLPDRVEWAVFSLLSTAGSLTESAFFDRIAGMFRGHDAPDEALVRACLESYRAPGSPRDPLRTNDELRARSGDHTELLGLLVEYGHRLGLRCWIGRREQRRVWNGAPLGALLSDAEERAYLPLISRGAEEALQDTDVIWYLRNQATMLFEVEWTAMLGEALQRRGSRIPTDDTIVRFLVVLPERTELVRFKLARSPLLREAFEAGNWHILKANHLRTIVAQEGADLDRFGPYLGLDPEIEEQGEQLPLFS